MPDFDYQLVVIGSGPGGYIAAIRASQLGLKTAIVEKDKTLGGTCLNVGCIPSKALLASSEHLHFAKERFAAHGIIASDIKLDLGAMMKRKGEVVTKLTGGVAYLMKKHKIEVVKGFGKPLDGHTVEVTDGGGAKKTLKTQEHHPRQRQRAGGAALPEIRRQKSHQQRPGHRARPGAEVDAGHRRGRHRARARLGLGAAWCAGHSH